MSTERSNRPQGYPYVPLQAGPAEFVPAAAHARPVAYVRAPLPPAPRPQPAPTAPAGYVVTQHYVAPQQQGIQQPVAGLPVGLAPHAAPAPSPAQPRRRSAPPPMMRRAPGQRARQSQPAPAQQATPRTSQRNRSAPPPRPRRPRRWLAWSGLSLIGLGLLVVLGFAAYTLSLLNDLPPAGEAGMPPVKLASIAYSADGQELARFYQENRTWVPYADMSDHLRDALLAVEDHRFFEHEGVDFYRTIGSLVRTAQGSRQGGSTITMQLVRNRYPEIAAAPTLERKLKEMLMAHRLEAAYSKERILEMYLNTVPFGYSAFGVEAAADTYFGKTAQDLNVSESATLVGMLKATTRYNPVRNPDLALQRRNLVLRQMVDHGTLSAQRAAQLQQAPLSLQFQPPRLLDSPAPYFATYVRTWLEDWAYLNGYDLYTDGLQVHTTLDTRLQAQARQAVAAQTQGLQAVADYEWSRAYPRTLARNTDTYERLRSQGAFSPFAHLWQTRTDLVDGYIRQTTRYRRSVARGTEAGQALRYLRADPLFMDSLRITHTRLAAGLVAIDPQTGHVKAWVGGRDFAQDQYDKVAQARRQPGSTFKPFVYAAALEMGYSPYDVFQDTVRTYRLASGGRWRPRNAGGRSSGRMVTLRDGLAHSKNTITAQLVQAVGPDRVARIAERAGVRKSSLQRVPALALGTSEVTLLEMTSAYATLADMGTYRPPVVVTRIEDRNGRVLASFLPEAEAALPAHTAYTVVDMMRRVVAPGGTAADLRRRYGLQADLAGKTGTTQDNTDGWFLTMHPHLVTGAWVGFNDQRIAFRTDYWGQGGHNALHLVGDFLQRTTRAGLLPGADDRFTPPPGYQPPRRPVYRPQLAGGVPNRGYGVHGDDDPGNEPYLLPPPDGGVFILSTPPPARPTQPAAQAQDRKIRW